MSFYYLIYRLANLSKLGEQGFEQPNLRLTIRARDNDQQPRMNAEARIKTTEISAIVCDQDKPLVHRAGGDAPIFSRSQSHMRDVIGLMPNGMRRTDKRRAQALVDQ